MSSSSSSNNHNNSVRLAGAAAGPERPWRPALHEMRAYNHLFGLISRTGCGGVTLETFLNLARGPGLDSARAQAIWQQTARDGLLRRGGFHAALKLVSLAQAGRPLALAHLDEPLPLPALAGVDWTRIPGYSPARVQRPWSRAQDAVAAGDISIDPRYAAPPRYELSAPACVVTPPHTPTAPTGSGSGSGSDCDCDDAAATESRESTLRPGGAEPSRPRAGLKASGFPDTESVDELLSRIDAAIGASSSSSSGGGLGEAHATPAETLRGELELRLADTRELRDREAAHTAHLEARVAEEEARLRELQEQLSAAQQSIAQMAERRAQLALRLQCVESQQDRVSIELAAVLAGAKSCDEDVGLLDIKMWGIERDLVRMRRRAVRWHKLADQPLGVPACARRHAEHTPGDDRACVPKKSRVAAAFSWIGSS
ncbi:hypothetical protein H4R18_004695 [Coemansia javaensis]|uniref:EH domain-containing protein n=1 Tax=Coemansia javaensis TaxID=2761396 RepID=A0A9W8LGJ0_9FUNG|nr:hypothetical protein H4R18_004695 [Coemansia javaensis]